MKKGILLIIGFLVLAACQPKTDESTQKVVNKTEVTLDLSETDVLPCSLLDRDAGERFCGFGAHRSMNNSFGTCFQAFQEKRIPLSYVVIEVKPPEENLSEAVRKFEWDLLTLRGLKSEKYADLFNYTLVNQSRVEFRVNDRLIRVAEIPGGTCKDWQGFVDLVYQKAHERFANQAQ